MIGLLASPQPGVGYAFTSPGLTGRYVAYGESALPANRFVERRGESIDTGLGRLRRAASTNHAKLDELLNRLVEDVRRDGGDDDTAIAALRWLD